MTESISLLAQREIEARMVAPLLENLAVSFGRDQILSSLARVIDNLGYESGRNVACQAGGNTLAHLREGIGLWTRNQALELEHLTCDAHRFFFNVRRCRYAEMYRRNGLTELGLVMSCGRDFAFARGFNPNLRLERTQTIMSGQDHCDFRFYLESKGNDHP